MLTHEVTDTTPALLPHQIDGYNFARSCIARGQPYWAQFMEQGTMKTRILIDIASNLWAEGLLDAVLVIAPNGVHGQWAMDEIPLWSPVEYQTLVPEFHTEKHKAKYKQFVMQDRNECLKWFCVNVESFSYGTYLPWIKAIFKYNEKVLVTVDESHTIKNPASARTINIEQGLSDVTKYRSRIIKCVPKSTYRAILTGTPITDHPFDIWSQGEFLCPGIWGMTYSAFKSRYGLEKVDHVAHTNRMFKRALTLREIQAIRSASDRGKCIEDISNLFAVSEEDINWILTNPGLTVPYKNLDELKARIQPWAFIRRKQDCLKLPPKLYETRYVEMNSEQKKAYKQLKSDMITEYDGMTLTALNSLSLAIRFSQVTSGFLPFSEEGTGKQVITQLGATSPKIEALVDEVEDAGVWPIIVFSRFRPEVQLAYDTLIKSFPEKRFALITGSVGYTDRIAIKKAFEEEELDCVVGMEQCLARGYNFQRAHIMHFLSNEFDYERRGQGEDRIHRGIQAYPCTYVDYVVRGTIDEHVLAVLRQKKDLLDYFRDTSNIGTFLGKL